MAESSRLEVTLSEDAAEFIRSKVSSGEFASESAVIDGGLEALRHEADERSRWEQTVLLPAYNRLMADPSSLIPGDEVEKHLNAKRRERTSAS